MSKYVQFEKLREKAESIVHREAPPPTRRARRGQEDEALSELEYELNVQKIEMELQREAMEDIEQRLEQRIQERTAELEGANRSLKAEIQVRRGIESHLRRNRRRLRSLASRLEEVEERERRRIAVNLHDLVGQTLATAKMKLGLIARTLSDDTERAELDELRRLHQRMLDETRNIITELSPPVLEEHDMRTAAKWLIAHFRDKYGLDITYEPELGSEEIAYPMRRFLFKGLRELLSNVVQHAQTAGTTVHIESGGDETKLEVADSGVGFDAHDLDQFEGFGLFSLRERVEALGGTLGVDSAPGRGTRVVVRVPRAADGPQPDAE
ncbi:MAG: sensor histidine kinase [Spirochaetota bacterium]